MPYKVAILVDLRTELVLVAYPDKCNTIPQFLKADYRRQLLRFLDMVNYLRQCCPVLAAAAGPLSELQESTQQWKWTVLYSHSFQT